MHQFVDNFILVVVVCLVFSESKISEKSQITPHGTIQVPIHILKKSGVVIDWRIPTSKGVKKLEKSELGSLRWEDTQ